MIHGYKEPVYTMTLDELIQKLQDLKEQNHQYSKVCFSSDDPDVEDSFVINDIEVNNYTGKVWLIGDKA